MTSNPIFRGAATALITPITETGVDYEAFGRLIDWQIDSGIDALVIAGTTGEGSTLSDDEHREVLRYAIERIAGRVPAIAGTGSNDTAYAIDMTRYACSLGYDGMLVVTPYYNKATQNGLIRMFTAIAGTGSNDTAYAIDMTRYACSLGYDGMLVVTPYYNKATQKGLIQMFTAIADASTKPLILYNVPSRTGVNIAPATYAALADHPNICAIKEANGDISSAVATASLVGDKLDLYSGNDDQIVPMLSIGGSGVISVLSNLIPKETSEICHKFFAGDVAGSAKMQFKYLELINALFCEVNPIPVKAAMAAMGFCKNYLRLPLTTMEKEHEEKLLSIMRSLDIIK